MSDDAGERRLVRAWQRGLGNPLRTTDGRLVQVVYRGRCPGGAGPDIRGALIAFNDGTLIEGDIEFHQRTSDWYTHGHHQDPRYRGVILHVVLVADAPPPTSLAGQPIPTLVVDPPEPTPPNDGLLAPDACHRAARQRDPTLISRLLDDLGDRRLAQRASRFEAERTRLTTEQLAYEATFEALGFSRNRSAFTRLAQALPVALLTALLGRRSVPDALDLAQAILFGVAGLLPSQREAHALDWEADAVASGLEDIWSLYRRDWEGACLSAADWVFAGVRPANYPTRRLATAAHLIVRFRDVGLDQALLAPLRRKTVAPTDLENLFLVDDTTGYWSTHCDFGRPLPRGHAALLGRDRARDVVVNVVLPLALAVADETGDRVLADSAWSVYRAFPRPSSYRATEKLAAEIGAADHVLRTARRQQGLLYLLRNHCERAACVSCPLLGGTDR